MAARGDGAAGVVAVAAAVLAGAMIESAVDGPTANAAQTAELIPRRRNLALRGTQRRPGCCVAAPVDPALLAVGRGPLRLGRPGGHTHSVDTADRLLRPRHHGRPEPGAAGAPPSSPRRRRSGLRQRRSRRSIVHAVWRAPVHDPRVERGHAGASGRLLGVHRSPRPVRERGQPGRRRAPPGAFQ